MFNMDYTQDNIVSGDKRVHRHLSKYRFCSTGAT